MPLERKKVGSASGTSTDSNFATWSGTTGDEIQDSGVAIQTGGAGTQFLSDDGTYTTVTGATDSDAIHDNVAGEISAITEKTTPVAADLLLIEDSADSNNKKKVQIVNLPKNIDGGSANSVYLVTQNIDGGSA